LIYPLRYACRFTAFFLFIKLIKMAKGMAESSSTTEITSNTSLRGGTETPAKLDITCNYSFYALACRCAKRGSQYSTRKVDSAS
jgi:hypothetical protein